MIQCPIHWNISLCPVTFLIHYSWKWAHYCQGEYFSLSYRKDFQHSEIVLPTLTTSYIMIWQLSRWQDYRIVTKIMAKGWATFYQYLLCVLFVERSFLYKIVQWINLFKKRLVCENMNWAMHLWLYNHRTPSCVVFLSRLSRKMVTQRKNKVKTKIKYMLFKERRKFVCDTSQKKEQFFSPHFDR